MNRRSALNRIARRVRGRGSDVTPRLEITSNLNDAEREIVGRARPFTMLSNERLVACVDAAAYVSRKKIPGAVVECGVWRGGAVLAMVMSLVAAGDTERDIYLFDTFEGMTEPGDVDVSLYDKPALDSWREFEGEGRKAWDYWFNKETFNLDDVKGLIHSSGYPPERIHFVVGRVEDTIPEGAPDEIAVLRLDTDWYQSTKHEMEHLYPRVVKGGVLMVDDYGHWDGSRRAVDEFFAGGGPLLSRIDYAGRIAVKE